MKVIRIKTTLNQNTYFKFYSLNEIKSIHFEFDFLNLLQKITLHFNDNSKLFLQQASQTDQTSQLSDQLKEFKKNGEMYLDYAAFELV